MRLSKHKPLHSLAFNMTPMIDIVFLLIIFFMTVSQITRTIDVPLPLPRVTTGNVDAQAASLTVNLDKEGSIMMGGEKLTLAETIALVQKKLASYNHDPSRIKIQVRCDRNCECRHVSKLLTSLSALGFTNVRSAVSDSQDANQTSRGSRDPPPWQFS